MVLSNLRIARLELRASHGVPALQTFSFSHESSYNAAEALETKTK